MSPVTARSSTRSRSTPVKPEIYAQALAAATGLLVREVVFVYRDCRVYAMTCGRPQHRRRNQPPGRNGSKSALAQVHRALWDEHDTEHRLICPIQDSRTTASGALYLELDRKTLG
jgi:hypothetical protein